MSDGNVLEFRRRARGNHDDQTDQSADAGPASEAPLHVVLEALLFVSSTPVTSDALADAADSTVREVEQALLEMMQRFCDTSCGIVLERVAGGWAFRASDAAQAGLIRMYDPQVDTRLSPASLETLAIVAYLQPVSRPEIARIRGVSVDAAMANLLERGLVEESGRSDTGAVLFRTTALFERAFGIASISELPALEGFGPGDEEMARLREQLDQMAAARVD